MLQLPLILMTDMVKKVVGEQRGKMIGNCTFWITFTILGQPFAALIYYYAWQAKFGSVHRTTVVGPGL